MEVTSHYNYRAFILEVKHTITYALSVLGIRNWLGQRQLYLEGGRLEPYRDYDISPDAPHGGGLEQFPACQKSSCLSSTSVSRLEFREHKKVDIFLRQVKRERKQKFAKIKKFTMSPGPHPLISNGDPNSEPENLRCPVKPLINIESRAYIYDTCQGLWLQILNYLTSRSFELIKSKNLN